MEEVLGVVVVQRQQLPVLVVGQLVSVEFLVGGSVVELLV